MYTGYFVCTYIYIYQIIDYSELLFYFFRIRYTHFRRYDACRSSCSLLSLLRAVPAYLRYELLGSPSRCTSSIRTGAYVSFVLGLSNSKTPLSTAGKQLIPEAHQARIQQVVMRCLMRFLPSFTVAAQFLLLRH